MPLFIAENATLRGNITIGENSSIWFGCVLRAEKEPIVIGKSTNIQDLVVMHVDPGYPIEIHDHVIIGHSSILHGCTINSNTMVGMGAVILNGANIGRFCVIGAGALVTKDMLIPDFSIVMGVPAKIVGQITPAQMEKNVENADAYVALAKDYAEGKYPPLGQHASGN